MKSTLLSFTFLLAVLFLASCSGTRDYDAVAKKVCECMTDMVELGQQYRTNKGAGNIGESFAMSPEVDNVTEEAEECMARIEEEHELDDMTSDAQLMDAIRRECPEAAAMLEEPME